MFKKLSLAVALLGAAVADAMPSGIVVNENGSFKVAGLTAQVYIFDHSWNLSHQMSKGVWKEPGYPVPSEKVYEHQGIIPVRETAGFRFHEWVRELSGTTVSYSMTLSSEAGIQCRNVSLNLTLPAREFDNKEMQINDRTVKITTRKNPFYNVRKLELASGANRVTIKGIFMVILQDERPHQVPSFGLRLCFTPSSGMIKNTKLELEISVSPIASTALNLNGTPASRSGENAAQLIRPTRVRGGEMTLGSVKFLLPDVKTKANAALVVGNTPAEIPVPADAGNTLYLIQNADSGAVPEITAIFPDGSQKKITLKEGVDFSAALPIPRLKNGAAVLADNRTTGGFYFSRFDFGGKTPAALRFYNAGTGEWRIPGATLTDGGFAPGAAESVCFMAEGDRWAKLEPYKAAASGSVLDFSAWNDAPAGKNGRIIIDKNGHFVAENDPARRIRFFGTNLCFSALFLEKADAEHLADELAKIGYNAVRIHHYDNALWSDSGELIPEMLDKLDYLFACMKRRGIYLTLDLYCSRYLRSGELMSFPDRQRFALKRAIFLSEEARDNWKKFVRALLTHRNPYTGMTWGADPALFGVSLLNETHALNLPENLYLAQCKKFLAQKNLPDTPANRNRFLAGLNCRVLGELTAYVKNELGYKGLITDVNFQQNAVLATIRNTFDWVDNHQYWDHPNFQPGNNWGMPMFHNQMSALRSAIWNPRTIMPSRIFGKPFTISEINYVFPNRYRAESGPILGAYAAFQDWDGIFRFSWSHNDQGVRHELPINRFDISQDSLSQMAERITALLFRQFDEIRPSTEGIAWEFGERSFDASGAGEFPTAFQMLGLSMRIGSLHESASWPGVRKITSETEIPTAVKSPGQIVYDSASGNLTVTAPRVESLAFFGREAKAKCLSLRDANCDFQIVAAASLDGKPLTQSGDILLFHLTDVTNDRLRYASETMRAVEDWGINRQLIRRGSADVALALPAGQYQVSALGLDGMPKATIPATFSADALRFKVDTARNGGTMTYRIMKQSVN